MICPQCLNDSVKRNGAGRTRCTTCGVTAKIEDIEFAAPDDKTLALLKERDQLARQNKRLLQESADLAAIKRCIGKIEADISNPPAYLSQPSKKTAKIVHGRPQLMLSDLHFGAVVHPNQVNGVNQYSTQIAKKRLRRVVDRSIGFLRGALSPGDFGGAFILDLGGDMVDGIIHDELRENADETVLQSVITLHDELVPIIKRLADDFGKCQVNCVPGNHGRIDKKPRYYNASQLNFDWLLYQFLCRTITNDPKYKGKCSFLIPDSGEAAFPVYSTRYLLTHGDKFKGGDGWSGALLPWTRGEAKKAKQYASINMPFDKMIIGHWHQCYFLKRINVNGSLIGHDNFGVAHGFEFELPAQALWVTHPEMGGIHETKIFAEDK